MRKIILSAFALILYSNITAQGSEAITGFSAGDIFLSGSVSYSSTKTGDLENNMFIVNPKAGFFVADNLVLGVHVGYGAGTQYIEGAAEEPLEADIATREAGFFGRYYYTPARRLSFFADLTAVYADTKSTPEGGPENKTSYAKAGLAPGINFFVSEHIAIEAMYGFLGYNQTNPDGPADNTDKFTIGANLNSLKFGIVYKI